MYRFTNDYNVTAHPKMLEALVNTSNQRFKGYGLDEISLQAEELIKRIAKAPNSKVHFIHGGTMTNLLFISYALRPHQAVIAAQTGHIAVHETGAIEATGHKVITIPTEDGKLTPELVLPVLETHCDEHMVQPKMVYISNTTEIGTFYTKKELQNLAKFCQKHQLYLYLDGARLAMALTAEGNDIELKDLAKYTDAFYIGGTKVGAFAGEAIVINNPILMPDFRFNMKQKGAIMAKGWILSSQFLTFFTDNFYFELGKHSNQMAKQIVEIINQYKIDFAVPPQTNQIFVKLPNASVKKIQKYFEVYADKIDDNFASVRFCTSWATMDEDIAYFARVMEKVVK